MDDCNYLSPEILTTYRNCYLPTPTDVTMPMTMQQRQLLEQLEHLHRLAELATISNPSAAMPLTYFANQTQLPTQLMVTDNSDNLVGQEYFLGLGASAKQSINSPSVYDYSLPHHQHPQQESQYLQYNLEGYNTNGLSIPTSHYQQDAIMAFSPGLLAPEITGQMFTHAHKLDSDEQHLHAHTVSSSPSSYVGYIRDYYDKSCSHCQNGSQPVVLSTNAALAASGLIINACDDPYCLTDAHPHPQHWPITYPYTAEQLLRRTTTAHQQSSTSEPILPTTANLAAAMCDECVDQHFVAGLTAPQLDLGAVPTYHVHTPTPTAHKKAKKSIGAPPQLLTESVLRLSRQLSEDALVAAIPIVEPKIPPPSILKKPKLIEYNNYLLRSNRNDRRRAFHEGQSRSLDYDDLHAKSWNRRRLRYEDEMYPYDQYQWPIDDYYSGSLDDPERLYGSETNIKQSYMRPSVDVRGKQPQSHPHFLVTDDKIVTIRYDSDVGWTRQNVAPSQFRELRRRYDNTTITTTTPYYKRKRNLPHPPSAQNAHMFSPIETSGNSIQDIFEMLPATLGEKGERQGPVGQQQATTEKLTTVTGKRSGRRGENESGSDRSNLVSINDQPEYFEYDDYYDHHSYTPQQQQKQHNLKTTETTGTTMKTYTSSSAVPVSGSGSVSIRQRGKEVPEQHQLHHMSLSSSGSGGTTSIAATVGTAATTTTSHLVANNAASSSSFATITTIHTDTATSTFTTTYTITHTSLSSTHTTTTTTSKKTTTATTTTANANANITANQTTPDTGADASVDGDPDAALDVIDWDAIDAMLDDDFSEYDVQDSSATKNVDGGTGVGDGAVTSSTGKKEGTENEKLGRCDLDNNYNFINFLK